MIDVVPAADHVTIGLVACAKTKAATAQPARQLYRSELFRRAAAYAEATYDHWFILSAQHYLVHPDEILEPYDKALQRMSAADRRHWGWSVESALRLGYGCATPGRRWPPPSDSPPRLQIGRWLEDGRRRGVDRAVELWFHAGATYVEPIVACLKQMSNRWATVHTPMVGLGVGEQLHWYGEQLRPAS